MGTQGPWLNMITSVFLSYTLKVHCTVNANKLFLPLKTRNSGSQRPITVTPYDKQQQYTVYASINEWVHRPQHAQKFRSYCSISKGVEPVPELWGPNGDTLEILPSGEIGKESVWWGLVSSLILGAFILQFSAVDQQKMIRVAVDISSFFTHFKKSLFWPLFCPHLWTDGCSVTIYTAPIGILFMFWLACKAKHFNNNLVEHQHLWAYFVLSS